MIGDTEARLVEWGRWARAGDERLGAKSAQLDGLRGSTVRSAMITDEDAERVDRAVSLLGMSSPELKALVVAYYKDQRSLSRLARATRQSRTTISAMRRSAVAWIDAKLDPDII